MPDSAGTPKLAAHRVEGIANDLHSAAIHLLRRVRKQDTKTGEGPARLSALSVLVFAGPMTLGELATAEQVRPPTMTRIVAALESRGLAEKVRDSEDARRVKIHATQKGSALLKRGRKLRVAYLAHQLRKLSDSELMTLGEGISVLERVLGNWGRS